MIFKFFIELRRRFLKRVLSPYYNHVHGQISSRSEIGRWISLLSSLDQNRVILEIGAWNGRGSSKLILEGLKSKPQGPVSVIGLESNLLMFKRAEKYLKRFPDYSLLWGSIVKPSELDSSELNVEEQIWFQQDVNHLDTAPNVIDKLPNSIDLLILDGGEFSTYSEFHKLESRVKNWIILDDVFTRKCRRIMIELESSTEWILVFKSQERNGTAVLKRVC
jgi:hypothetical protein